MKFSLAFTFFRSLELAHLEKSIFSLSRQTIQPDEAVFYDNNTRFTMDEIRSVVALHYPLERWTFVFDKHGDPTKTATYCHNRLIERLSHDQFVLSRADLILDPTYCKWVLEACNWDWINFSASWMFQMPYHSEKGKPHSEVDHAADLEQLNWRQNVQNLLTNDEGASLHKGPELDAAAFCMNRRAWKMVGGYNEKFFRWGFWEMNFQSELKRMGVQFKTINQPLTFHMMHALVPEEGERDLVRAMKDAEAVHSK